MQLNQKIDDVKTMFSKNAAGFGITMALTGALSLSGTVSDKAPTAARLVSGAVGVALLAGGYKAIGKSEENTHPEKTEKTVSSDATNSVSQLYAAASYVAGYTPPALRETPVGWSRNVPRPGTVQ